MALADEDIETILRAQLGDQMDEVLNLAGIASSGNNVADFKLLAEVMGLDPEDLLYALFAADEPLFEPDTWNDLTQSWDEPE